MPIDIDEITSRLRDEQEKIASGSPQEEFEASLLGEEKTAEEESKGEPKKEEPKKEEPKGEEPKGEEPKGEEPEKTASLSDEEILNKLASDQEVQMQVAQADLVGRALARGYYDELQQLIMPQSNYPAPQPGTGGEIPQKSHQPQPSPPASPKEANPGGTEKQASVDILTELYNQNFTN